MCLYFSPLNLSLGSSGLMQNSHWTQKTSPLVMVNQATDRRVTETGGSTTGDTFMFLIKVLLSPRRDRWRQLRYKLTREISCLPTLVSISLFCYLACPPPLSPPPFVCARVWVRASVVQQQHPKESGGPKLIKCWKWGLCSEWRSHGACPQRLDGK